MHVGGPEKGNHQFVIQEQAALIQVGRSGQRQFGVDDDGLGMDHFIDQPDAGACGCHLAQGGRPRQIGQPVVGMTRQHQVNGHAAPGGQRQRHQQRGIGHKVGRDDQDASARREATGDQQGIQRVLRLVGAAGNQLRSRHVGGRLCKRGQRQCRRRPLRGKGPVLVKALLRLPRQVAAKVKAQVDPGRFLRLAGRVAGKVFGCQVASPGPHAPAIGNHHLAVIAQVGAAGQRRAKRRDEQRHLHAGRRQRLQVGPSAQVHADAVHQQADPHAAARLTHQQFADFLPQGVAAQKEGTDVERFPGLQQHAAKRGQRFLAVLVNGQLLVRRSARKAHGGGQLLEPVRRRIRWGSVNRQDGRVAQQRAARHLAAAEQQVQRQRQVRHQRERHDPGDGCRRVPALAPGMRGDDVDHQARQRHQAMHRQSPLAQKLMEPGHHEASAWQRCRLATAGVDRDGQVCIESLYRRGGAATAVNRCQKFEGFHYLQLRTESTLALKFA